MSEVVHPMGESEEVLDGLNRAFDALLHHEGPSTATDAVEFAMAYVEANADDVDDVLCPHCPETV